MRSATLWLKLHRRYYREHLVHPVRYNRDKRRLAKCNLSRSAKQSALEFQERPVAQPLMALRTAYNTTLHPDLAFIAFYEEMRVAVLTLLKAARV